MTLFIFILTIYLFALVSNLSIVLVAKIFGVKVEEFSLGFSPGFHLFQTKINGCNFTLGWFPSGGSVKLSGVQLEEGLIVEPFHFAKLTLLKKFSLLFIGAFSILIFAVLALVSINALDHRSAGMLLLGVLFFSSILLLLIYLVSKLRKTSISWSFGLILAIYSGYLVGLFLWIDNFFPIFDDLSAVISGNFQEGFFSRELNQLAVQQLFAGFGLVSFFLGLLPFGGMIGALILTNLGEAISKERWPQKSFDRYWIVTFFLAFFIYGWFLYNLL